MPVPQIDLLQGTLEFLVLKTLSWGPMHGFAIGRWIRKQTDDALEIEEGRCIPHCTGWSGGAGSRPSGG